MSDDKETIDQKLHETRQRQRSIEDRDKADKGRIPDGERLDSWHSANRGIHSERLELLKARQSLAEREGDYRVVADIDHGLAESQREVESSTRQLKQLRGLD